VGLLSVELGSLINLVEALMALAMLTIAARPADDDHAYGTHPGISGLSMRRASHRVRHYGPGDTGPEVGDPAGPASAIAFQPVPPGIFLDTKTVEMLISTSTERRTS